MTGKSGSSQTGIIVLYLILLAGFFAASFFTDIRIWGISTWGYLPLWVRVVFVLVGLGAIPIALKVGNATSPDNSPSRGRTILTIVTAMLVAGVCFWLFRGQTHFLGDGYGNIGLLSSRVPIIINRDFGEMRAHLWLAYLFGGNTKENVLLSYQILSVTAGVLSVGLISWTAQLLFERTRDAILFALTVLLSGQVLLFFGYVENYSLFALAVAGFTCVGLLAALGRLPRWTILIPLIVAIVLHVFGVIFILPAVYLLLAGGKLEKKIVAFSGPARLLIVIAAAAAVAVALWLAMDYSLFLRIALLSLTDSRFTVEGYTLFSLAHLADYGNLLLLLLPGLPLLLIGLWEARVGTLLSRTDYRFLLVLVVTALIPAFIFDPKLGMPRDWDLFSYAAVPMSILLAYTLLDRHANLRLNRAILTLAVILAGLSTVARVSTQFVPSMGLRQVQDYLDLDRLKAKGATILLQSYFAEARNREEFDRWGQLFLAYADERLIMQADTLMAQNRLTDALVRLNQARQRNPMNAVLYSRMSVIYLKLGRADEARAAIDTALGLSPSNPDALVGRGFFLQRDGKLTEAERSYIRATETGPDRSLAWFYLARLKQSQHDSAQYIRYLDTAATKSDAAPEVHVELCNAYIAQGRWQEAVEALRNGMERGLSGQVVERVLQSHPELQRYWGR